MMWPRVKLALVATVNENDSILQMLLASVDDEFRMLLNSVISESSCEISEKSSRSIGVRGRNNNNDNKTKEKRKRIKRAS